MEHVLVTGSNGLVGFRVAECLAAQGVAVRGFDLHPAPVRAPFASRVGSLADRAAVTAALHGCDAVVHAGAVSGPMLLRDDPYAVAEANLGGALTVFEAACRAGVRRLVWTSAIALRLSTVYGGRRRTQCTLRDIILAARAGRPAVVAAPGTSHRQFLHVEDAAAAVLLALAAPAGHRFACNITGGTWLPEAEIAGMIGEVLPGLVVAHGPEAWNEGHPGPLVLDAARRDLGYTPRVALGDGLAELAAYLTAGAGPATDGSA